MYSFDVRYERLVEVNVVTQLTTELRLNTALLTA